MIKLAQSIPDLFAGESIRIQGRYATPGRYVIKVKGKVQGRAATLPLAINLPTQSEQGEAIPLIWARSAIKEKMRLLNLPHNMRSVSLSDKALKQEVTQLGLDFSLMTQWTAFIAVSKRKYNPNANQTPTENIPLPIVKGITQHAYGNPAQTNSPNLRRPVGSVVPEPAMIFGLLLVIFILGSFARKQLQIKKTS